MFTPVRNQLRHGMVLLHTTSVRFAWPVGKTGKLLTPYIRFTKEKRPEILASNPEISVPELGKRLGELWRELPESERQRYKEEYSKAKEAQK